MFADANVEGERNICRGGYQPPALQGLDFRLRNREDNILPYRVCTEENECAQTVVPWYQGTVGANCVRPRAFKERPYGEYMFADVGVEGSEGRICCAVAQLDMRFALDMLLTQLDIRLRRSICLLSQT